MPQSDFFAELFPPEPVVSISSALPWHCHLTDQVIRDTQALADPLNSESDRAFFYARIAMYKAEVFRLTGGRTCAP